MAISLEKEPLIREYTPVHLLDEEETIIKSTCSEPPCTPAMLNIEVATEQHSPEIVEPIFDTEVTEQSSFPSYSQLVQDGRQEHLAKVFQRPTEQEWSAFEKIKEQLIPIIKKSHKCETSCFVAIGIALLSISVAIAMMLFSQWLIMGIGFVLFVLACIAIYLSIRTSPYDIDAPSNCDQPLHLVETICGIESAQNLLVCSSGADTTVFRNYCFNLI